MQQHRLLPVVRLVQLQRPHSCYYSQPCGFSHDAEQPIGISTPAANSVKAVSQSPLRWLTASSFTEQPAPQHRQQHGNGGETAAAGEGATRCDSLTGPERESSSSSTVSYSLTEETHRVVSRPFSTLSPLPPLSVSLSHTHTRTH